MSDDSDDDLLVDALTGALAGVIGVWALDRVDWALYDREGEEAHQRTQQARPGGLDPAHLLADRAARLLGKRPPPQPNPAGLTIHYAIGVGGAVLYSLLRRRAPAVRLGGGALFGALVWLTQDEGLNPLLGLSGKPQEYPATTHLRGLAAHMAFGMVTELVLWLRPQRSAVPQT